MNKDHRNMLEELLNHDPDSDARELTEWELEFVEDLVMRGRSLSERQTAELTEIWGRIFGGELSLLD